MRVRATTRARGRAAEERGVAAVEFALILSLLVMLVFGIIEFGRTYSQYEVFLNAAREGARTGAIRHSQSDMQSAVTNASTGYTLSATPTITVDGVAASDPPCNDQTVGHSVAVSWNQTFAISIPLLPAWSPSVRIRGVFTCE
jgi:Flp pilus assembly protein TadG